MPESRTETGQFKPGTSGNPGGRPKGIASRVRDAVKDGEDIVTFLVNIFTSPIESTRDRLSAAQILLERGWGKAAQVIDVAEGQGRVEVKLSFDPSANGDSDG